MEFRRYSNIELFDNDVYPLLAGYEVQNNLFIGLIQGGKTRSSANWLLATVRERSSILLTILYIEPFDLLLFETGNEVNDDSLEILAGELRRIDLFPPGVMAESGLAERFADSFYGAGMNRLHMRIGAMKLDKLSEYRKSHGRCRELESSDMFFAPYWECAFSEDCRARRLSIEENTRRLNSRLGKSCHFIWEDGVPVSQAVHGRDTPNGAVINGVYTPPPYRGRGYATSVVAETSKKMLERGKDFCCLFSDDSNPVARRMYKNIGYYDVCELKVMKAI